MAHGSVHVEVIGGWAVHVFQEKQPYVRVWHSSVAVGVHTGHCLLSMKKDGVLSFPKT